MPTNPDYEYVVTRPFPQSLSGRVSDLIPSSCRSVWIDHGDETETYPGRGMCCLTAHKSDINAARRAIRVARAEAATRKGYAMSNPVNVEIVNLKTTLFVVVAEYAAAQKRWDRASSKDAKEANLDAIDKWNCADRAIRAAIARLEILASVSASASASKASKKAATQTRLVPRIENALQAADRMADLALTLNEGIESKPLRAAVRVYVKAARGLDLRPFITDGEG